MFCNFVWSCIGEYLKVKWILQTNLATNESLKSYLFFVGTMLHVADGKLYGNLWWIYHMWYIYDGAIWWGRSSVYNILPFIPCLYIDLYSPLINLVSRNFKGHRRFGNWGPFELGPASPPLPSPHLGGSVVMYCMDRMIAFRGLSCLGLAIKRHNMISIFSSVIISYFITVHFRCPFK